LPEGLVDAELFGNARNYPNPGMPERQGLIGEAHGSMLFLDELAELPHASQAHLLRVLDNGEYHRLGEGTPRQSVFRLIAATNRDPTELKHDLLARLTVRIATIPLDSRREDVPLLVRHILRRAARAGDAVARRYVASAPLEADPVLPIGVVRRLLESRYELNVRALESTLFEQLQTPDIATESGIAPPEHSAVVPPAARDSGAQDPERIQRCLDENNGVLDSTWRALGMRNRFALLRAIKKHGLVVRKRPGLGKLRRSKSES
jgi:DNA-binding NtrC family response regulator